MEGKNYSAVPPPPSLTNKESSVNFSDALSKARAIAEKLKQTPSTAAAAPEQPFSVGTKRGHDDSPLATFDQQEDRENKRSAYDVGSSRPSHIPNKTHRYALTSEEQKAISNYGTNSSRQDEYKVPNHMVGLLIGKGGENLKKIERMSGVSKVQFAPDTYGPERVVHIVGESDQIIIARDMIRQMVDDAKATEASRVALPPGAYHYQGNLSGNSMMIRIPVPKVGLVIGRGGETIREFEQQSRAKILLSSDSSNDINNERAITLVGTEAAIQHAKRLIEDIVYGSPDLAMPGYSQYGFGPAGGPNGQRIYVPIPSTVVGLIIGRGGETIRYFQEQSGARVKVDLTGDPNAEERNVCISGEPQALAVAKRLVEEKVAEANPEYAAKYSSPSYTSFYEQQFQQYNYAQYYAQYGYDQYQAYAQYNYTGYQSTAGAAEAAPTTGTENAIDPNNIAETAATYYAHYYGHPQTQDQKDAYNQWFQQYYGQYYNQPSQQKEEGGSTSSLENNSKEIKEEKNQSDETKEEKDGDDSKKRKKNE